MRRVLIIDDEKEYLELFREFLSHRGFEVYCANESAGGIEKFRQVRPDIVFLDWEMPRITGGELFKILQVSCPEQKVVFISGHPPDELKRDHYTEGAVDYLDKGDGLKRITDCLAQHLN